ncbi:MAG: hypothetical protein WCD75_16315, partial [Rhodoplanes sp.]
WYPARRYKLTSEADGFHLEATYSGLIASNGSTLTILAICRRSIIKAIGGNTEVVYHQLANLSHVIIGEVRIAWLM